MTSPSQAKGQPFQIPIWVGALDEGEPVTLVDGRATVTLEAESATRFVSL
jgi:hypothetical protein